MSNLERAIELATLAHRGQVDKAGRPYILHPLELMSRFADADADAKIVAVLHDTIEDSDLDAAALRADPRKSEWTGARLTFREQDTQRRSWATSMVTVSTTCS